MKILIGRSYWPLGLLLMIVAPWVGAGEAADYSYATHGVKDHMSGGGGAEWKLLLDASNLGGAELEMVEVTLAAGTAVPSHRHAVLEVIYVLSGTYEHEVNGKRYSLTPGMVGLVRPGDQVRHLVPPGGAPAKLLIIWAPGGEAARVVGRLKGTSTAAVPEVAAAGPAP